MLKVGLKYNSSVEVTDSHTALSMGSGDMAVFATPAMSALMENAAMLAVAEFLPDGATTVGTRLNISHVRASAIGAKVVAEAELVAIEGRRLEFKVVASDDAGVIGEGEHTRFIVDKERFLSKLK